MELGLRPKNLDEYTGQRETIERLKIAIQAAKTRNETLDHLLLHGPPGLEKPRWRISSPKNGPRHRTHFCPALERPGDVMGFLVNAKEGDIIFIDEIHRLPRIVEEFLYSAMEDFIVNFTLDKGMYSKPLPIRLEKFTIIGATTRPAMLTRPLRDRFGLQQHFDFYAEDDLVSIVRRSAFLLGSEVNAEGAREIARRSRGDAARGESFAAPRARLADVRADGQITRPSPRMRSVGRHRRTRLDRLDHEVMRVIRETYDGGPVGIEALAATLNEKPIRSSTWWSRIY
jgi:Holliday junction DNA helicase RuvB